MRYLTIGEVLRLHLLVAQQTGGASGVRDASALESALAQPRMTFGGQELYPGVLEKAAALCFFIVSGHPFIDGNKRTGHAAMETFLVLNGFEIDARTYEQERVILAVAAGEMRLEAFTEWLSPHLKRAEP